VEELRSALIGLFAGILGGIGAYSMLNLALMLEWQAVKAALRRQYQRERRERPLDINPRPQAIMDQPLTPEDIMAIARKSGLTRDSLRGE